MSAVLIVWLGVFGAVPVETVGAFDLSACEKMAAQWKAISPKHDAACLRVER